ncbi:MAG: hypothetical protein JXA30_06895 [Deltaproteobacteria bacterium]|nr:hypothetical protein [Deltaproteobacteria bacterium]
MKGLKSRAKTGKKSQICSPKVLNRILSYNVLLRDEVKIVCELARSEHAAELSSRADSLEHLVRTQTMLVEGVIEALLPDTIDED